MHYCYAIFVHESLFTFPYYNVGHKSIIGYNVHTPLPIMNKINKINNHLICTVGKKLSFPVNPNSIRVIIPKQFDEGTYLLQQTWAFKLQLL